MLAFEICIDLLPSSEEPGSLGEFSIERHHYGAGDMLYLRNHAIKGLAGDIAHFVPEPDPFVAGIVQSPVKRPRWDAEADDGDSSLAADRRGRFFHDEELRWRRRGFFFPGTNRRPARVHENRTPVTRSQGPPQSPVASRGGAFLFGNLTSADLCLYPVSWTTQSGTSL